MTSSPRLALAGGLATALLALTSCSGPGTSSTGAGSAAGASVAGRAPAAAVGSVDSVGSKVGAGGSTASRPAVRTKAVVRTGDLALTAEDLDTVRGEVTDLLAAVGGSVDREVTRNDRHGRIAESTLVLRVPVARFDATRAAIGRLGRLTSSTESAKDVTTEVIDTTERVQTLRNSLDRLQRFQRSARDARDLIRYEDQITARQSELRSLEAQQSYLADQTSMATITLHLSTPRTRVEPAGALDHAGFLAGLRHGWDGLVALGVVVLTVLGAVLPFGLVVGVVGVPLWLLLRALLRRRRAPAPPPASS